MFGLLSRMILGEHPVDMAQPTFVELYSIPAFRNLNEKQIGNADSFVDNILSDITSDDDIVALLEPFTLPDVQFDLGSIQNVRQTFKILQYERSTKLSIHSISKYSCVCDRLVALCSVMAGSALPAITFCWRFAYFFSLFSCPR